MKTYIVYCLLCLFFLSCTQREKKINVYPLNLKESSQVIKIDKQIPVFTKKYEEVAKIVIPEYAEPYLAESLIEDYEYVSLETTDDCLLSTIDKLYCDSSCIFIYDSGSEAVFCFSEAGMFICKYGKKGRGPDEYVRLRSMALNKSRKEVCLYDDFGHKLMFYNYEGNLLRTEYTYFGYHDVEFSTDYMVVNTGFWQNSNFPPIDYHRLVLCKLDQQPEFVGFPYPIAYRSHFGYITTEISAFDDQIYYSDELSDTIWRVNNGYSSAQYIIEFPNEKSSFSSSDLELLTDENYRELIKNSKYSTRKFSQSEEFLCLTLVDCGELVPLIYSRKSGAVKYGIPYATTSQDNKVNLANFLFTGAVQFVNERGEFIAVNQSHQILDYSRVLMEQGYLAPNAKDKKLLENLSEEDNPVLMLVKLKDF